MSEITKEERIEALLKHLKLFEESWDGTKPFNSQKKYIKAYISNFKGASELRKELMKLDTTKEVINVLNNFC